MSAVSFDTLKFAKRLEAAGLPANLAEAEAQAFQEALAESGLAAQQDITDLRHEPREMKAEINGRLTLVHWMLGAVLAVTTANFAKQYF